MRFHHLPPAFQQEVEASLYIEGRKCITPSVEIHPHDLQIGEKFQYRVSYGRLPQSGYQYVESSIHPIDRIEGNNTVLRIFIQSQLYATLVRNIFEDDA